MIPTPETVLMTITAVANAVSKTMDFLMSPNGQALVTKSIEDRTKWDKFWADTGEAFKRFFKLEL